MTSTSDQPVLIESYGKVIPVIPGQQVQGLNGEPKSVRDASDASNARARK